MDDTVDVANWDIDLSPALAAIKQKRRMGEPLLGVTIEEYKAHFDGAVAEMGLGGR